MANTSKVDLRPVLAAACDNQMAMADYLDFVHGCDRRRFPGAAAMAAATRRAVASSRVLLELVADPPAGEFTASASYAFPLPKGSKE